MADQGHEGSLLDCSHWLQASTATRPVRPGSLEINMTFGFTYFSSWTVSDPSVPGPEARGANEEEGEKWEGKKSHVLQSLGKSKCQEHKTLARDAMRLSGLCWDNWENRIPRVFLRNSHCKEEAFLHGC